MKNWWHGIDLAKLPRNHEGQLDVDSCQAILVANALGGDGCVYVGGVRGELLPGGDRAALVAAIEAAGGRCVQVREFEGRWSALFTWAYGLCQLGCGRKSLEDVALAYIVADETLAGELKAVASTRIGTVSSTDGSVYVLGNGRDGQVELNPLGVAGIPLERGNYAPAVLEEFDHVVAELGSMTPCGRLVLIDGEPGTGKSYLVRGLLSAHKSDATFILVPPDLLHALSGPAFIPALLEERRLSENEGAIVLVLEDADECLAPRMADNINSVATMLAFGDGILGAMMDIRIVATTNRKKAELDPALMRAGRLCRRISVGPLSAEQANVVARRLNPDLTLGYKSGAKVILAEVYQLARKGA